MDDTFAPSELVWLHGEAFADAALSTDTAVRLLHSAQDVVAGQLITAVWTVAFLSNEQAGTLEIQLRDVRTGFLSLGKARLIYAEPTKVAAHWPEPSLELELLRQAQKLYAKGGKNDVASVMQALGGRDGVIEWIEAALVQRGLMQTYEEKSGGKRGPRYLLPDSTARMAAAQSIGVIQERLLVSEERRPKLHSLLLEQIERGG